MGRICRNEGRRLNNKETKEQSKRSLHPMLGGKKMATKGHREHKDGGELTANPFDKLRTGEREIREPDRRERLARFSPMETRAAIGVNRAKPG